MNCLEFRRLAQVDLRRLPSSAQTHLEHCAACQTFAARMREVDEAVAGTLNEVAVPDGLSERILLTIPGRRTSSWPQWALAASIVLGLAFTLALPILRADPGLARAALAHVEEEPDALTARQQVAAPAVATALASVGAQLRGDIGQVTYLGSCPLPGGEGRHLVVTSPYGRYSLILMPAQTKHRRQAEDGMHAAVAKPAARGTYAIVASATPDLMRIERLLDQQVAWR
jgi:hypothetical protein